MTEPRNPSLPDDSEFGVLRIKAGPGGGAVRLAALVRDLMERHQMARAEAVKGLLLKPLTPPVDSPFGEFNPPALYLLQPGGNALPLGDREWFATVSGAPGPAGGRCVFSRGIGCDAPQRAQAASLGLEFTGFVAWLRGVIKGANFDPTGAYSRCW